MKRFRKQLAFILSLLMAFTLLPLHAFASGNVGATSYGDLYYTKYDDHIEIVGCKDTAVDVVIPATIDDLPVTVISGTKNADNKVVSGAFAGLEYLQSVDMSQAPITTIENNTFSGSHQLYSVTFPSTLKTIGDEAFKDSFLLYQEDDPRSAITLPDSLETIGNRVFQGCSRLQFVTLSDNSSLTTIGNSAFSNCSSLESFNFPDGLTSMGFGAFSSCKALTSVDLSNTQLTEIPESAFAQYQGALASVALPDSLVTIGKDAFSGCISLTTIIWPQSNNLKTVSGFQGCTSLTDEDFANMPSSVTTIGESAFWDCTALTGEFFDELPSNVTTIGENAFYGCSFTTVAVPESVKTIGACAFSSCANISSLTFPSGLTSIGDEAFCDCVGLIGKTIDIPATVTYIGAWAFGFIYDDSEPLTLIIRNRDLSLEPDEGLADADIICIYDANNENPLMNITGEDTQEWDNVNFLGYKTTSNNTNSDLYTLYERKAEKGQSVTFTDLGSEPLTQEYTVSGIIPEGATVKLYRGNTEITTTAGTEPNSFTANVEAGEAVRIVISLTGYSDYILEKTVAEFTSDWNIGEITVDNMTPLPMNHKIRASVIRNGVPLVSTENLSFTLKNGDTTLIEGTDYTVEYPYFVLDKSIEQDASITLIVEPSTDFKAAGGSSTGSKATGEFEEIELIPWGHAKLTLNGSFSGSNTVLVFNAEGKLVDSGSAPDGYQTSSLPAGTYTFIAFNKNDLFSSFASLSQFNSMGLTQGEDYARGNVTISDDAEATLTLSVPILDTDSLASILADEGNAVLVETLKVGLGNTAAMRVQYSLKNAPLSAVNVIVELPENSVLSGVYDETSELTASFVGNTLTIPVTAQAGTFYIYFAANKAGEQSVSASITQGGVTAPLGTASFTVETIFIELGTRWTTTRGGTAMIYAGPETQVAIIMPDGSNRNLVTNKAGRLRVNYTLPDTAASGDRFTITASTDTVSTSETIVYMSSDRQIEEFYFIHSGIQTYLVENGSDAPTRYYTYVAAGNEADKYWTFGATITSPDEMPEDTPVTVVIGMMDGSTMSFDLTRISESGSAGGYEYTYVGEIYFDQLGYHEFKSSLIPCEFDLIFEDQVQSIDTDAQFANAWNDAMDRMDLIQSAFSDTDVFNPQVMGELLSGFYKVSDKDWFAELPDDTKTAVLEAETQLEGAAKEFCLALKIPYDSVDEFLIPSDDPDTAPSLNVDKVLENNGISMSAYDGFDADALAADGYTIYTVPSQRRGPQQRVAIKETDEGIYTISEEEGFKLEVDYAQNAADNAATAAFIDSLSTVGDAAETAADALEVAGKAGSLPVLGKMAGGAANIATVLDLRNNVNDMGGIYSDIENLKGYITNRQMWYNRYLNLHVSDKCLASMRAEIRAANELLDYLQRHARSLERDICLGITMFAVGVVVGGPAIAVLSLTIDYTTNSASMSRASMIEIYMHNLNIATARVMRDCEGEEEKALRRWKLQAILDPSGVVYEAIESNVLEGVTATMWYADNAAGTGAVQWDASEYDQVNPQVTAADGRFAWDVPTGFWQVRFAKAGYEDAATEWLEVPPPRMNLLVPMVTTKAPNVESANAYEDYIEVIFDQYMDKSAALTLPDGMTGEWQGTDAYSKVLRITKDGGFTKGDEVELTISGAKNYAGTPLPAYSKTLTVGARPAEIILNYESVAAMKAGTTPNVTVRVKDSDGNYMSGVTIDAVTGNTSLATIAASAVTDESGKAVLAASALLPGLTDMTFTVNGTTLSKSIDLRITVDDNKPLRPTATIGSTEFNAASPKENAITVDSGETLTISAEDGVSIFYTTDDTCPCQNSASRNVYTGPITLDATTRYRIAAYKDGMMYSDRLNINVTVNTPVEPDPDDPVEPDPVVPDPVNPSPLENRITGINAGDTYTIGQVITFTAIGAGMDNTAPNAGDTRWMPASWSVNPHGDFAAGFTQSFPSAEMKLGAHTLHVMFAEQRYDGTTWNNTGNEDEKTVDFMLLAANTPTDEPTVEPTVVPASDTSYNGTVPNTADDSMSWLWNWVLMFSVVGLCATVSMKNKEKEYII